MVEIVNDSFNYDQPQNELRSISNEVNISHLAHIHWFTLKPYKNGTDSQW